MSYSQNEIDYWRGEQDKREAKYRFQELPPLANAMTVSLPIAVGCDIPALLEHLKQVDEENWAKLIAAR